MELIFEWVKNLVFFYILMTAVLQLLPKSSYQKYVRFFCGLLLVVLLLSPILELFDRPDELLGRISYQAFKQETDTIRLDAAGVEESQRQAYKREYERAVAGDVALLAEGEEFTVAESQVELTGEYQIAAIRLTILPRGEKAGTLLEKAIFPDESSEYPGVLELKQKIMQFYQVTASQIEIHVEG